MPLIEIETCIKAPLEVVFDLARSIDVHILTQSKHRERAVAGVTSGVISLGQSVTWEAVHFGVRQHLTSKITEFDPPHHFTDEMTQGAFKSFRHLHDFVSIEEGTKMIDRFDYRSPYGWLGLLADKLVLEKYMRDLLVSRNAVIKSEAEKFNFPLSAK